jgi:hypothetical protein
MSGLAAAATTTVVAVAKSVYAIVIAAVGVRNHVGRNGTIATESTDQFCGLSLLVSRDESILASLRSLETKRLILVAETIKFLISKVTKNTIRAAALAVNDVASVLLVLKLDRVNGTLSCAAAIANLTREAVETCLGVVTEGADSVIHTVETRHHSLINTVEALAKSLLNTCEALRLAKLEIVEATENSAVVEACGYVVGSSYLTKFITKVLVVAVVAPTVVTPATEQQKQNPPAVAPAIAEATATVTTVLVHAYC